MLTMEGEKELPPVLEVAFRRVPAARKGWEAMTKAQRRHESDGGFLLSEPGGAARSAWKGGGGLSEGGGEMRERFSFFAADGDEPHAAAQ